MNRIFKWTAPLMLTAASVLSAAGSAIAQEASIRRQPRAQVNAEVFPLVAETLAEQLEEAFYSNDQDYYENRSIPRQLLWVLGISHTENEVNRDGAATHRVIEQLWKEQGRDTAVIRTRDLPNPYQSSLLLDPTLPEQEFAPTSIRQPIAAPPAIPVRPAVTPRPTLTPTPGPVRALW